MTTSRLPQPDDAMLHGAVQILNTYLHDILNADPRTQHSVATFLMHFTGRRARPIAVALTREDSRLIHTLANALNCAAITNLAGAASDVASSIDGTPVADTRKETNS